MGSGASLAKLDLSNVENLEDEFRKHGDIAVRRAWELTATQISSDSDLEMHLAQLRRLAGTLTKDKKSIENKERRLWLKRQIAAIDKSIKKTSGKAVKRRSCFKDAMTPLARSLKITAIVEVDEDRIPSSPKATDVPISSTDGDTSCSDAEYSAYSRPNSSSSTGSNSCGRPSSGSSSRQHSGSLHPSRHGASSSRRDFRHPSKVQEDEAYADDVPPLWFTESMDGPFRRITSTGDAGDSTDDEGPRERDEPGREKERKRGRRKKKARDGGIEGGKPKPPRQNSK